MSAVARLALRYLGYDLNMWETQLNKEAQSPTLYESATPEVQKNLQDGFLQHCQDRVVALRYLIDLVENDLDLKDVLE
jgi:hypothetical protein